MFSFGLFFLAIAFCVIFALIINILEKTLWQTFGQAAAMKLRSILLSLVLLLTFVIIVMSFQYNSVEHCCLALKYGNSNVVHMSEYGRTLSNTMLNYARENNLTLLYTSCEIEYGDAKCIAVFLKQSSDDYDSVSTTYDKLTK